MQGTSSVRLRFFARIVPPMCFATSGSSCVRSSIRFLKLWWQIALECGCVKVASCRGCMRNTIVFCSWKSYWNGCIKAAKVNCQPIFLILALIIFLLKFLLKSASKLSFCRFGVEIRFWTCNFRRHCTKFYCVLQLSRCRSHCSGCVKVAWCSDYMRNTIVFYTWRSLIVLEWLHHGCESDLSADFLNFGANNFFLKIPFKKCFKIVFLSLWRRDPVLELQFLLWLYTRKLLCAKTFSVKACCV